MLSFPKCTISGIMTAFLVWAVNATAAASQDIDCLDLDALSCVSSSACMLTAQSTCTAPWDRCQIGFQQAILDETGHVIDAKKHQTTIAQCLSQAGCSYVQAAQCYCPPDVECICGGGEPPNCLPTDGGQLSPPVGAFMVVDARAVTGVASTQQLQDTSEIIGTLAEFAQSDLRLGDLTCDTWEIRETDTPLDTADPLLWDVFLGPVEFVEAMIDHKALASWNYGCEGESLFDLVAVDGRVLVVVWANGAVHLILERPMSRDDIRLAQASLKDYKFLNQEPNGQLDAATLNALSAWAEYQSRQEQPYRFLRTAITENLLVGLIGN